LPPNEQIGIGDWIGEKATDEAIGAKKKGNKNTDWA